MVAENIQRADYAEGMSARTVDWTVLRAASAGAPGAGAPGDGAPGAEGLRERKKRLMRQQLSDTATEMFLERGFDAVRVAEVAQACGVSEKTVFNYFPTKESLLLDRGEATMASLRAALAERAGLCPDDPEPWITATALLGLWDVQSQSLGRYLDGTRSPEQVREAVTADISRAARLLGAGLSSWPASPLS